MNKFTTSENGIRLITHYEGLKLHSYQDSTGIWTVGYGHTGHDVYPGQVITQDHAEELLKSDLQKFENIINTHVTYSINQDQFDALVSFVYNVGPGLKNVKDGLIQLKSGISSSLLRDVNNGNFFAASKDFLSWTRAGGVVLLGLVRRRKSESTLFSFGYLDFERSNNA